MAQAATASGGSIEFRKSSGHNHEGIDLDAKPDLRKRMTNRLLEFAHDAAPFLAPQDRDVVLGVIVRGESATSFATPLGKSPRQARIHARRLLKRIASAEFRLAIRLLSNAGPIAGTATRKNIARECFVNGVSIRGAAKKLGLTMHMVRSHATAIRNQAELVGIRTDERAAG